MQFGSDQKIIETDERFYIMERERENDLRRITELESKLSESRETEGE